MNTALKIASLAVAMAFGNAAQAASVLIDDFNGSGFANTASNFTDTPGGSYNPAYAGAIGGFRDVSAFSPTINGTQVTVVGGVYGHSQTVGAFGTSTLTWDGSGTPGSGFSAIDLTDGGINDVIRFVIVDTDGNLDGNQFELTINGQTIVHTFTQAQEDAFDDDGYLNVDFSLASFSGASAATSISLFIDGMHNDAWDVSIDNIGAIDINVPEPGTILLFGAGLVGMASRLQRKLS